MKKIMFLCAVVLGFISFSAMQSATPPEFKFEADVHDFGKIPAGKPVSHEFKFTNTGDQPLIISTVEPACGCTLANFTKTPVKKGQSGSITLSYNAAAVAPFSKVATVKSNARTALITLTLKGEVIADPKGAM